MNTITDVARLAGVSKATVSRVLGGRNAEVVAPATAERVLRAAQQLGYRPNPVAAALATGKTGVIALWIRNVHRPFFAELMRYVAEHTRRHGLDLIIVEQRRGGLDQEDSDPAGSQWPVDGILAHEPPGAIYGRWMGTRPNVPVVALTEIDFEGTDSVRIDLHRATCEAVEHLVAQGCRGIAYMGRPEVRRATFGRYPAYREVMQRHQREELFIPIEPLMESFEAGQEAMRGFFSQGGAADAVFCHNDELAVGAIRALHDLGMEVPRDVAVIGCDDVPMAAFVEPPLTTIHVPLQRMVEAAFNMLMERIGAPDRPISKLTLQGQPIVRRSSVRRLGYSGQEESS